MVNIKNDEKHARSGRREIGGVLVGLIGLMLLLAMISYDPAEISLLRNQIDVINLIGPLGARCAFYAFIYFGAAGYILPFAFIWLGLIGLLRSGRKVYPRALWFGVALFCLAAICDMATGMFWYQLALRLGIGSPGGLLGNVLAHRALESLIGPVGALILCWAFLVISLLRMFDVHLVDVGRVVWGWFKNRTESAPATDEVAEPKPKREKKKRAEKRKKMGEEPAAEEESIFDFATENVGADSKVVSKKKEKAAKPQKLKIVKEETDRVEKGFSGFSEKTTYENYSLPPLDLLDTAIRQRASMSADQVSEVAQVLQSALEEFGVEAKVTGVQQGPVVTCYEILPAPGVRVERIKALSDNLALKMRAESIRIQAPIPGKGVCGVELPNTERASVFFRELIESKAFQSGKQALPLVLGKDTSGKSMIYDLAKMPHLLIAGATGAGKSVCMNSILTGLLMRHGPDDLRLILVDPKTVEFQAYNNLPHLVVPVITNAKKVSLGLRWAIDEMERRFKWFSQTGVRDLPSFNSRTVETQADLFGEEELPAPDPKNDVPNTLPYIVIVIDELADLMAVAQADIEAGIARLAAKSRAAGIHMILATQRPDVKVITGTIKANFPVRIAFKVSQKVDSRTILDRMGADSLLGKGDMLLLPPGSDKLIRSQGAYTSDGEIERVTEFCKEQGKPEFIAEIHEKIEKPVSDLPEVDTGEDDEILAQAMEVIRQTKRASTSSLQRRLRIGYTRAARLMDLLEERGVVGPPNGSDPREVLIDLDGEIPQNTGVKDGTAN